MHHKSFVFDMYLDIYNRSKVLYYYFKCMMTRPDKPGIFNRWAGTPKEVMELIKRGNHVSFKGAIALVVH